MRVARFLRKPWSEQRRIVKTRLTAAFVGAIRTHVERLYLGYMPDSFVNHREHLEFRELYVSFTRGNRKNNNGDIARLWSLILNIKSVVEEAGVPGDFAELGVFRGNTSSVLVHYGARYGRKTYLFDTFEGFSEQDLVGVDGGRPLAFSDTSVAFVKEVIGERNKDGVVFVKGYFPASIPAELDGTQFAVVSLDAILHQPMKAGLEWFYPRMAKGAIFLLHDYSSGEWAGTRQAVDEFCRETGEQCILMPDKSGSAFMRIARASPSGEPQPS